MNENGPLLGGRSAMGAEVDANASCEINCEQSGWSCVWPMDSVCVDAAKSLLFKSKICWLGSMLPGGGCGWTVVVMLSGDMGCCSNCCCSRLGCGWEDMDGS